eukprot:gene6801-4881_t
MGSPAVSPLGEASFRLCAAFYDFYNSRIKEYSVLEDVNKDLDYFDEIEVNIEANAAPIFSYCSSGGVPRSLRFFCGLCAAPALVFKQTSLSATHPLLHSRNCYRQAKLGAEKTTTTTTKLRKKLNKQQQQSSDITKKAERMKEGRSRYFPSLPPLSGSYTHRSSTAGLTLTVQKTRTSGGDEN